MQALDRRISALEQTCTYTKYNLIIRYDEPGKTDAELWSLEHYSDESPRQEWTRRSDESEKDFTDRAISEVKRNSYGVACLMQNDLESQHAGT